MFHGHTITCVERRMKSQDFSETMMMVLVIFFAWLVYAQGDPNIPPSELDALRDIYDELGGQRWLWSDDPALGVPWNFSGNPYPCTSNNTYTWQGVLCSFEPPFEYFHVRSLSLNSLGLFGQVPSTIDQLHNLTSLLMYNNSITGTFQSAICNLRALGILDFEDNDLSGPIPHDITNLQRLTDLRLQGNALTGSIPAFLSSLVQLVYLDLGENGLTGTIPEKWSDLTNLQFIDTSSNSLHGTLPAFLPTLPNLKGIEMSENGLTGTIPAEYMNMANLLAWFCYGNQLTGTLPSNINELNTIRFLNLGDNYISGTIPAAITALSTLAYLHIFDNILTGPLPHQIGDLSQLVQIYLFGNYISGSLPASIAQLYSLRQLQLNDNVLTGNIDSVFNSTGQTKLSVIQLGNNRLTGTLPGEPFLLPALVSLTVSVNCFHGAFPTEACASTKLLNLLMDGLHSSTACQHKILPGLTSAYTTMHHVFDRVPLCYFNLPRLASLHLSGNELTGTLPSDLVVSDALIDLSLSHNALRGEIPPNIQRRAWLNLDLSYNLLEGTLKVDFGQPIYHSHFGWLAYDRADSDTTLSLGNNRLSGHIPSVLQNMQNISILKENVFSCAADKSDLPQRDEEKSNYNCGSTVFDTPYYVWIGLVCTVCGAIVAARVWHERIDPYFDVSALARQAKVWVNVGHSVDYQSRMKTYNHVCDICQIVCMVSFACAALSLLVMAPIYITLTSLYGTHTHQYAWDVSAAFVEGRIPFGILLVAFTGVICLLLGFYARNLSYNHRDWRSVLSEREQKELEGSAERKQLTKANLWERVTTYTPMVIVNFLVVFSANVAFVYFVLYGSSAALTVAQLALSMFKLFWNKVGSRLLSRWTAHRISQKNVRFARSEFFALQLFIAVVNNIGIPCLVIIFTSPACIYNMFVPVDPTVSHYASLECQESRGTTCSEYKTIVHTNQFNPPYTYSYECSASFITYYAAAFVTLCIFSAFGTPIIQFTCMPLYPYTRSGTWLRFFMKRLVPKLLRPPKPNLLPGDKEMDLFRPFFDANQLLLTLLTNLAIMLTFGVVFPPLAASMAFTILSIFYFARIKVGIFIHAAVAANSPCLIDIVDRECQGVGFMPVLHQSIWTLVVVAFVFYTWFLFDTLGNTEGFAGAFWVFIVVPLLPLIILPAHIALRSDAYARVRPGAARALDATALPEAGQQVDVELATIVKAESQEALNVLHVVVVQDPAAAPSAE